MCTANPNNGEDACFGCVIDDIIDRDDNGFRFDMKKVQDLIY